MNKSIKYTYVHIPTGYTWGGNFPLSKKEDFIKYFNDYFKDSTGIIRLENHNIFYFYSSPRWTNIKTVIEEFELIEINE